jgi:methylmalonyl-CoA/ethylmalonyl-CoA epimerase
MSLHHLDHTAIAVRDMDEALERYRVTFGLEPSDRQRVDEQAVEVAFLPLGGSQIELICPTTPESGVARFLERHGESLHHVAFAVTDIEAELQRLARQGVELIDRTPRQGAHGRVAFIHPRGTGGVLVELVEHQ